jgi:hypothetical protein
VKATVFRGYQTGTIRKEIARVLDTDKGASETLQEFKTRRAKLLETDADDIPAIFYESWDPKTRTGTGFLLSSIFKTILKGWLNPYTKGAKKGGGGTTIAAKYSLRRLSTHAIAYAYTAVCIVGAFVAFDLTTSYRHRR